MLAYQLSPSSSFSMVLREHVFPRAKQFKDDVFFDHAYVHDGAQQHLQQYRSTLHRYFCAYRDPRSKKVTHRTWVEFIKTSQMCSNLTGLTITRAMVNFVRSLVKNVDSSDLRAEEFYEAIARCAVDIFVSRNPDFVHAMHKQPGLGKVVRSWAIRLKQRVSSKHLQQDSSTSLEASNCGDPDYSSGINAHQADKGARIDFNEIVLAAPLPQHVFCNCISHIVKFLREGPPDRAAQMSAWRKDVTEDPSKKLIDRQHRGFKHAASAAMIRT